MSKDDRTTVRGHTCEGLVGFLLHEDRYACTPTITENGLIAACDDQSSVPVQFCPFCGSKLND